jgi:hypothetical protein
MSKRKARLLRHLIGLPCRFWSKLGVPVSGLNHHSRSELMGAGFLFLAGYPGGAVLFLLIQRLKPKEEAQGDALSGMTGQ